MSVSFVPPQKGRPSPSPAQIQKMLDENSQLIQGILDYQSKGKSSECLQYQQILHRNLVYLASIADAVPSLLPPPPTQILGAGSHQAPGEPSRIPSPSINQGGVQQNQVNIPTGSRGNQAPGVTGVSPGSGAVPAANVPPHTSYSMTVQSTSQIHPQSTVNHVQSPSTQQSTTQVTHSAPQNSTNAYSSRSVAPQQYGSVQGPQQYRTYGPSQGQPPHPSYSTSVQSPNSFPQQNSSNNFSNESSNFQTPASQSQSFVSAQQQSQVVTTPNQMQQQHTSQAPEYSSSTVSQTSYTSSSTVATVSQSYSSQSSQTYVTPTQSYSSTAASASSTAAWYQANNSAQPCTTSQQSFGASAVTQGYAAPVHSISFGSPSVGSTQSASAGGGGYGSPPTNPSGQGGFVHHSPSSAPHESPPPSASVQPNRFTSNFSNYVHYRPPSQQASHSMSPPSNNASRPQAPSSTSQSQNYNYDQSQNYPYQSQ